jgi:cyanobactin maturation PatA/PatG family protease
VQRCTTLCVMEIRSALTGLSSLQAESLGNPGVCIAVLDGPVDLSHTCFDGAALRQIDTLVQDVAGTGPMSVHGTHVASLIFGQPDSPVFGVAPRCQGLIVPIFRDSQEGHLSQLDLARAIEQAVHEGAHIINVSGGERSPIGQADGTLERALRLCDDNNVLVVAAAGNDGCECLHVPAALPSVLAVGAIDSSGAPLETSNWGEAYRSNGVLAPGEDIKGGRPGGGTVSLTGSSFATPAVSGVAALLLGTQHGNSRAGSPRAVGKAILEAAVPCQPRDSPECHAYLVGTLNIPGAYALVTKGGKNTVSNTDVVEVSPQLAQGNVTQAPEASLGRSGVGINPAQAEPTAEVSEAAPGQVAGERVAEAVEVPALRAGSDSPALARHGAPAHGVQPSGDCNCNGAKSYVFPIGLIAYDFGTDARRDTFRQLMPRVEVPGSPPATVPPNPYDVNQLYEYLTLNPSESTKLIWTLNLDLTPIYAIEAELPYAEDVYSVLRDALKNESLPNTDDDYVSRVSLSGVLTNKTRRLFSGQVVPVVIAQPNRGLYTWRERALADAVVQAVLAESAALGTGAPDPAEVHLTVRQFLDKVYYELRNLGQSPPDRALNFAATNAYVFAEGVLQQGILSARRVPGAARLPAGQQPGLYSLDTITVAKSPYCRMDSDCWDVRITFFDPENDQRARCVFQFTIDVSDVMPVSLAPTHTFLIHG